MHLRTVIQVVALLSLAAAALGCSESSSSPAATPENDAALDVVEDTASDGSATLDAAEEDVSEPPPDAQDAAAFDAAVEAGSSTWGGAPWWGCTSDDEPAGTTVVTAFDLADQYFNPEDKRTIEADVTFPPIGSWDRVDLRLELSCPVDGKCDHWDRFANLVMVDGAGTADEEIVELQRYITPYNYGLCMRTDMTGLAPRLVGQKKLRSFIDTWVGPASASDGHGWRVTAKFIFYPGTGGTGGTLADSISLWSYQDVAVGDPANPAGAQTGTKNISIPADVTKAEVRMLSTGHGQGNRSNCTEFCGLQKIVTVNGQKFSYNPWRNDCGQNPIGSHQSGTWKYARAGWCPGAVVDPTVIDVTSALVAGQDNTFAFGITAGTQGDYENTCRPGQGGATNTCTGCAFSNAAGNCDYNGGNHTPPVEKTSAVLLLYR